MPRAKIIALCLVFSCLLAAPAWAGGVLSFAPQCQVSGRKVTLLDLVAQPESLEREVATRLSSQVVMSSPRLGRRVKIQGSRIRSLLRQAQLPAGYSVLIPAEVMVSTASQRVTTRQMIEAFRKALIERLGPKAKQADIHGIQAGRDVLVPAGKLAITVRFLGDSLTGRVSAQLEIMVNGSREAQGRVEGQVDLYGPVVVARDAMSRRHIITRDEVRVVRMNYSRLSGPVATDPGQVIGLRTRNAVNVGEAVPLNRLERAPLIRRGDVVTMICRSQGFKVTAKGKAEETGFKGESIRLLNLASRREVYGRVQDPGTVIVDF